MNKLDQALQFHQTALSLRAQRQQVLASNIANADTPNYKARDFDFTQAMSAALAGTQKTAALPPPAMLKTSAAHFSGNTGAGGLGTASASVNSTSSGVPLQYRSVMQGSLDNNTVDMDVERNQFADNAIRYEASVTMISGQIKSMLAAITG